MPVYQQNYKIPTHSDNKFYHSKYWEEFTPYDKPITGCKVKAILINCSDSLVTFDDKKNKNKQICVEVTRCIFLILNSKTNEPTNNYIEYKIWGRRKTQEANQQWSEWGTNSWEVQQFMGICASQKTPEEMAVANEFDNATVYPELCGSVFTLAVAQKGIYTTKNSSIPQYKVEFFYPDGRSYEEVEGNILAKDCLDLKKAIEDCKKVYAEFLEKYGSDGEPATPYGSMPVAPVAPVVEQVQTVTEPSPVQADDDDLPF